MDRRHFLAGCGSLAAGALASPVALAGSRASVVTLLHTNDTHSRIDPFASGTYKGKAGIAQRAALIASIRAKQPATIVVDAGDIFQGTPYFNLFRGRVELETMSRAGYDISAIGNHDFDLGAGWLLTAIDRYASFSFCCANLVFSQPAAQKLVHPFKIRYVGGRKLGFFGLGVRFRGLVPAHLHRGVRYTDPVATARRMVRILREKHRCEAVIALSHLGFRGFRGEPGDVDLASQVRGIDLIVGGHTHTFLSKARVVKNAFHEQTSIVQVGHSGIWLGRVDLLFGSKGDLRIQERSLPVESPPAPPARGR